MTISSANLFSADDGEFDKATDATPSRRLRRHSSECPADDAIAEELIDVVHPLTELLPVPPVPRASLAGLAEADHRPRIPHWPVYDPTGVRRRRMPEWLVKYTVALVAGDLGAAALAFSLAQVLPLPGSAAWSSAIAVLLWPVLQALMGSYAERHLDTGRNEYLRVAVAGLAAASLLAVVQSLTPGGLGRLVLVAVPGAVILSVVGRVLQRRRLRAARLQGRMTKHVIVVGREVAVMDMVRRLRRDPAAGLEVIGACVPRPRESSELVAAGVAVLGSLADAAEIIEEARADAVVVASASETAGSYLRELAWRLEGTGIDVLVGPGMIEVAPSRLHVRATTSMPLIHIRQPEFRGHRRVLKVAFDRCLAAALLVLTAPLFLAVAAAIRITSPGPALYRHQRIGKHGVEFNLLKFRSMRNDRVPDEALLALNEGNAVQFKLRQDPRVTPVGRFLRRYSLDELPQLINVLKGEMSLVGPRPHVTREVEQYGDDMRRRLLVAPGLTGLWQVSGRSNLSWDDAVELDVRYVENWSIGLDLSILARTFRAVLGNTGAY